MPSTFADLKTKALEAKKLADKAADAAKGRDRGADYRGRTPGGMLGAKGALQPHGRLRPSEGYSYARAIAVSKGFILPESAPEEIETDRFLRDTLEPMGFQPSCGERGFLAVGSSRFLPTHTAKGQPIDVMMKFQGEIREKMLATAPKWYDFDRPDVKTMLYSYMRAKGMTNEAEAMKEISGQKAMGQTVDSLGGTLVPAPAQGEFIDLQRNFEAFTRAGAREVSLPPQGRISYPKQVGGSTAYWVGEAAAITESDAATSNLYLEAKTLAVLTRLSAQLQRFSDPQAEGIIRYDQAMQAGLKADSAMFTGTGGTQIAGLLGGTYPIGAAGTVWTQGTDNILQRTASTTATDGNTLQPQDPIKLSQSLPDPVQAMPKTFIFYTPQAMAIMSRRADAVTANDQAGPFVFNLNRDPETGLPNGLYGNRVITSYNVPSNRIKGNGTNLTVLIVGAFSDWFIARSGVVEFDTNPYTYFNQLQTQLRTVQYLDAGPRHNASFGFIDQLLPTT